MEKIIIAEDSQSIKSTLSTMIEQKLPFLVEQPKTFDDLKECIGEHAKDVLLAIVNLNFGTAKEGQVIDYCLSHKIPVIVLTSSLDSSVRKRLIGKGVVDYVLKESRLSFEYIERVLKRLHFNKHQGALVVDDSTSSRIWMKTMLERQNHQVFEACNGIEALEQLEKHPDIRVVITDYMMPEMDGIELTKQIRKSYSMKRMAVVGLSGAKDDFISARFIKNGASDYLKKPFSYEELLWRMIATMESFDL